MILVTFRPSEAYLFEEEYIRMASSSKLSFTQGFWSFHALGLENLNTGYTATPF
jgi:hypothetical protein